MNIIYVLIPIAMIFVSIGVVVFFWSVKSNQYDDLDREAVNILFDEDILETTHKKISDTDLIPTKEPEKNHVTKPQTNTGNKESDAS